MLDLLRYGARHRVRESVVGAVGVALLAGAVVWTYPSGTLDPLVAAYPRAFGATSPSGLQSVLAVGLYDVVWVGLFGLYTAYAGAGTIAVRPGRMDSWLALPVRRWRLLVERYLTLLVPVVVLNVVTPVVVYAGAWLVDEPVAVRDLAVVHALSVPYLLTTGAIGLVVGVAITRERVARPVAVAVVLALFLVETLVTGTRYAVVGAASPTRYYDPTVVLGRGQYDYVSAGVLLGAAVILVALAAVLFSRRDVG